MAQFCLLLVFLLAFGASVRAGEFEDLKARVWQRAKSLQELKDRAVLREGGDGLLQAAEGQIDSAESEVMDAENADRTRLFELIARRTGSTPDKVAGEFARRAAVPQPARPAAKASAPAVPTANASPPQRETPDRPTEPMRNDRTAVLPLKVLTKPFSNVYTAPDANAQKLRDNVPAFTSLYVYEKRGGWYQTGSSTHGSNLGWMKADDVIEWKQNLVVQFTHPKDRQRVLMFDKSSPLQQLASLPKSSRIPQVQKLYDIIDSRNIPTDFPVSGIEPKRPLESTNPKRDERGRDNKDKDVFLLPIVDFQQDQIDGREGRLLRVAAVTRRRGSTKFDHVVPEDVNKPIDPARARDLKVDLVFVMDLTKSMQPFASRTLQMINAIAQQAGSDPTALGVFRFGIWGYRDNPEICGPGMEWNTHNFTPELQTLNEFALTLSNVRETKTDSIDFEEDVLAGMADATDKTRWRDDALHFLILVGDAPGREPKEPDPFDNHKPHPIGSARRMRTEEVRALADAMKVYVSALYLKSDPKWAKYEQIGAEQFGKFSKNLNDHSGRSNFRLLNGGDATVYGATAQSIADGILAGVREAQEGRIRPLAEAPGPDNTPAPTDVDTPEEGVVAGREMANNMFQGALVDYLAKKDAPEPPNDVTVWVSDKDLLDPVVQSFEAQVLLTKNDLNSLKLMLDKVIDAGLRGKITGEDFFKALQAVVATSVSDPGQISNAETLAATNLAPKFLEGLPYRSRLMNLTGDTWRHMGPDEQEQFLRDLQSKLELYQSLHDSNPTMDETKWQKLNEDDDPGDAVIGVPLDSMP
jgi:hypothetical protein